MSKSTIPRSADHRPRSGSSRAQHVTTLAVPGHTGDSIASPSARLRRAQVLQLKEEMVGGMMISADDIASIRQECEKNPLFTEGRAYDRAKICFEVMTRLGLPLPSWTVARSIIGKGSPQDINKAKADFRVEHGEMLTRMAGAPEGIPEELRQPMQVVWRAALKSCRDAMAEEEAGRQQELQAARAAATQSVMERDEAVKAARQSAEDVARLREEVKDARRALELEREIRAQSAKALERAVNDFSQQRAEFAKMMAVNKREFAAAVKQFEFLSKGKAPRKTLPRSKT